MFEPRPKEPAYAFVPQVDHPEQNRWGQSIETVPPGHELRGKSLNINGDAAVSDKIMLNSGQDFSRNRWILPV